MTDFNAPLKSEIKTKYGISNDDFDVLTSDTTPDASTLKKLGQYLEPVAWSFGVPTFMLKNKYGLIMAIIFVPLWGPVACQRFQDATIVAHSYYEAMMNTTEQLEEQIPRYAITIPDNMSLVDNPIDLGSGTFPIGTGIYPFV